VQRPGSGLTLSRAPHCSDPGPARARAHVHRPRRSLLSSPPHAPRPSSPAPLRELPGLPARTEPTAPRRGRLPAPALLLATLARTPRHQQQQLATAHARAHAPHPAHACVHTLAAPRRAEPCTPLRQLRSRATPQPARSLPRVHAPRPGLPVCPRARTRPRRTEPRRRPSARTAVPSHTPTAPATSAQRRLRRLTPAPRRRITSSPARKRAPPLTRRQCCTAPMSPLAGAPSPQPT